MVEKGVYAREWGELQLSHLYRALDILRENILTVEETLFARSRDPLHLDVDLALFDTNSTHFEEQEYIVGISLRKWRAANEVLKQGGSTKWLAILR